MRRTDRLFELIQMFRGGRLWRGKELAERLETSLRTIYRDIDTLVASGIPIESARGIGYILREPIFLPPLTLSRNELDALHVGMRLVAGMGDEELARGAEALMQKIASVLPTDRKGAVYAAGIAIHAPALAESQTALPVIRSAIEARRITRFVYERLDGASIERAVRPLHVEYWGRVWTLTAWCELRSDFRVFRVDRIGDLEVTDLPFANESGKTYRDYLLRHCGETG